MFIQTKKTHRYGKQVQIANVTFDFDLKGMAQVKDEKQIDAILTADPTLKVFDAEGNSLSVETSNLTEESNPSKTGSGVEVLVTGNESVSDAETKAYIEKLNTMTKAALSKEAADLEFPEDEWKELNKAELLQYLIEKVSN